MYAASPAPGILLVTGRSVGYLRVATQRKYLTALSNMLKRAKSNWTIKTNFVADLVVRVEGSPNQNCLERRPLPKT